MKQVATKGRRLLRKILTVLSLGAVAVTFQACYGMPVEDEPSTYLRGTVKSSATEAAIRGIRVSSSGNSIHTNDEGRYRISVYDWDQIVLFEDIDGPENGAFENKEITWNPSNGDLHVFLDPLDPMDP
jgi:hypothetical protein